MQAIFESYVKHAGSKANAEDEDILEYSRVEVLKDMTAQGPRKGEKYLQVDFHTLSGDAVFRLKNGGCRVVMFSTRKAPVFTGEFKGPERVVADD